ncbi:MAG: hypothetical protein Q7R49_05675, partial [Candidatus Daviesbacteria bacterium]|nr:hypothetical protein [Candidatus Daviesbacteria bacterium]
EAFTAFQTQLTGLGESENLELDFEGVITFSPSWGDEFLSPLLKKYSTRLILMNTRNLSVKATLELLESINQQPFKISQ